jgi:hypothetical protein
MRCRLNNQEITNMSYASSKVKVYKNDWSAHFWRDGNGACTWYCASVRNATGELYDKVRCDDYRVALDHWRAFNAIARAAK